MAPNAGTRRFLTIHRFGHRLGRGERSGGLSTAKFHVVSARVFLDMSQEARIPYIIEVYDSIS